MENDKVGTEELLELTADIVSSHVANNTVSVADLPKLIEQVFDTLQSLSAGNDGANNLPEPAVPIEESIQPNFLVCLEDGKKLKMLKRHLMTQYSMTPEEYRDRWGLPIDYPMVAPNYADRRRELAKKIGLGRGKRK